jgi:hypothetical protein
VNIETKAKCAQAVLISALCKAKQPGFPGCFAFELWSLFFRIAIIDGDFLNVHTKVLQVVTGGQYLTSGTTVPTEKVWDGIIFGNLQPLRLR